MRVGFFSWIFRLVKGKTCQQFYLTLFMFYGVILKYFYNVFLGGGMASFFKISTHSAWLNIVQLSIIVRRNVCSGVFFYNF